MKAIVGAHNQHRHNSTHLGLASQRDLQGLLSPYDSGHEDFNSQRTHPLPQSQGNNCEWGRWMRGDLDRVVDAVQGVMW